MQIFNFVIVNGEILDQNHDNVEEKNEQPKCKKKGNVSVIRLTRRQGKTSIAICRALERAVTPGQKIAIFVDNFMIGHDVAQRIMDILKLGGKSFESRTRGVFTFANGSEISVMVCKEPNLCGYSCDFAIFDVLDSTLKKKGMDDRLVVLVAMGADVLLLPNVEGCDAAM